MRHKDHRNGRPGPTRRKFETCAPGIECMKRRRVVRGCAARDRCFAKLEIFEVGTIFFFNTIKAPRKCKRMRARARAPVEKKELSNAEFKIEICTKRGALRFFLRIRSAFYFPDTPFRLLPLNFSKLSPASREFFRIFPNFHEFFRIRPRINVRSKPIS